MRAILTYHSIDPSGSVISVDEGTFRRQADWLVASGVNVVSVSDLLNMQGDEDGLALTFDDAFENFGSVAWPVLRERELPATVFVVAGVTGATNRWGGREAEGIPTLELLDWRRLAELAEDGAEIGSHTLNHVRLKGLDAGALQEEVEASAAQIEREIGTRPEGFAYPYGSWDRAAEEAAKGAYDWACTTDFAPLSADSPRHRLPRLDAYYFRSAGQLETWGTARFRARLGFRRAARSVRSRLMGANA